MVGRPRSLVFGLLQVSTVAETRDVVQPARAVAASCGSARQVLRTTDTFEELQLVSSHTTEECACSLQNG
jgi:hypothetical protein